MGAMSELDIELEVYWRQANVGCYWSRQLPDGREITISSGSQGYTIVVDRREVWRGESLPGAIVAAGRIAREQLADMARMWAV